ncbi:MAG: tetratricopeptide repeat protein [Anaerolineae bacterium]
MIKIADLLGHLPLALSIVAGRIALEPHTTAEGYLAQLQVEKAGLDALAHEEQSVRASFNSCFAALTPAEQAFFAALGVFGGEDFGADAVTAVTNTPQPATQSYLNRLYNLSLVQAGKNQRYRLHPLRREYAQAQMGDTAVYQRMIAYFNQYVIENQGNFRAIEQELDNILTALDTAFSQGFAATGIQLTINLADFLAKSGLRDLAKSLMSRAEETAESLEDGKNLALIKCAQGHIEKGRIWHQAQVHFETAVKIANATQDEKTIAQVLKEAGIFYYAHGDYDKAQFHWEKSLILARKNDYFDLQIFLYNYLAGIAVNHANDYYQGESLLLEGLALQRKHQNLPAMSLHLMNLSSIVFSLGNYAQTHDYLQESEKIAAKIKYPLVQIILSGHRAALIIAREGDYEKAKTILLASLKMARELGDTAVTGFILARLGSVNAHLGQLGEAVVNLQEALLFSIETRRQDIEIEVLTCFGFIAGQQKQSSLAQSHFEKALILARSYNDKWFLGKTLADWGEFNLTRQNWQQAQQAFAELLSISQQSDFAELTAEAWFGLARVTQAQNELPEAKTLGEQSRGLFAEIGHHKRKIVRAWLDDLPFSPGQWRSDSVGDGVRPLN